MYATVEDVRNRYGKELFALAGKTEAGDLDEAAVTRALEEASSEIDVTLSARYAVPVSPAPSVLRRVCVDLAVAALPRNGFFRGVARRAARWEARALPQSIAAGDAGLGADTPPAPAQGSGGGMAYSFPASDFRQKLDEL